MAVGAMKMGRPKRGQKIPKPEDKGDARETVIHMKGSRAYVEWLDELHRKTHIPKVQIFRIAVADWARRGGHSEPPEM